MINARPENSRLIGESLFREIAKGLLGSTYYALIGPRKIGKSLILKEVKKLFNSKKKGEISIVTLQYVESKTQTVPQIIKALAESLRVKITEKISENGRLANIILQLIELRLKIYPGKTIFMIDDILSFPPHIARELLAVFKVCYESEKYENRISSVVTGSTDFIAMVVSYTSPYRFAQLLSIEGLEKQFAKKFFTGKLLEPNIDEETFDYLYEETHGSTFLFQELSEAKVKQCFFERKGPHSLSVRSLKEAKELVRYYQDNYMEESLCIQQLIRDIETRVEAFDRFVEILWCPKSKEVKLHSDQNSDFFGVEKIGGSPAAPPYFSSIPFLVGCGAVIRDENHYPHVSSPLLMRFYKNRCSKRHIADVYSKQHRWDKAWATYAKCHEDEKYRSISGESRFKLYEILVDWENSMHLKAQEGVEPLVNHFINGVRHLLVFDDWGMWDLVGDRFQPMSKKGATQGIPVTKAKKYWNEIKKLAKDSTCICMGDVQLEVIAVIPPQPPAIPPIIIIIKRSHEDREIDTSSFNVIKKVMTGFCTALTYALHIEYEKYLRKVRDSHLKTLDLVHLAMAKTPLNLNYVLDEACKSLVEAGYHRILICLVDSSRTRIVGSNEYSKLNDLLLKKNTNYLLCEPEKDVQPWIVNYKVSCVLNNAYSDSRSNRDLAKAADIRGAGITPMMVEDVVVGTLHFERGDKIPPGHEEMALFDLFANQLGAAIIQGQRLAMLRDTLHAIDNPIIIRDVQENVLFLNDRAAKIAEKEAGWQKDTKNLDNYFRPKADGEDKQMHANYENRLAQVVSKEGTLSQYWAPYNRNGSSATTWVGSPLKDDWGEIIGTVERFQDISAMYDLFKTIDKSRRTDDLQERGRIHLQLIQGHGYPKARLYILKNNSKKNKEFLESFAAVGFLSEKRHKEFEAGGVIIPRDSEHRVSELCIVEAMPLIILHDPTLTENKIIEGADQMGLPLRRVSEIFAKEALEKKDGEVWIDVPIFSGDRCVGKMSVSHPKNFTPEKWQYLKLFAQSAGLAIDSAIRQKRDREEIEHNVVVARMLSHRLSSSLGRCLSICKEIGEEQLIEYDRRFYSTLLANRFLGMQILIDYLLSGGAVVGRLAFEKIDFYTFLLELKQSIDFEIEDWKRAGLKSLQNWDCTIMITLQPQDVRISGIRYLLFRAIENLAVNAMEAMMEKRESGMVKINYQKRKEDLEINIYNNGPPITPPEHIDYINSIIESSGKLEELTKISPPGVTEDRHGEHHQLGLKISTWIVKEIHRGKIDLLWDENKSPYFQIQLPINNTKEMLVEKQTPQ